MLCCPSRVHLHLSVRSCALVGSLYGNRCRGLVLQSVVPFEGVDGVSRHRGTEFRCKTHLIRVRARVRKRERFHVACWMHFWCVFMYFLMRIHVFCDAYSCIFYAFPCILMYFLYILDAFFVNFGALLTMIGTFLVFFAPILMYCDDFWRWFDKFECKLMDFDICDVFWMNLDVFVMFFNAFWWFTRHTQNTADWYSVTCFSYVPHNSVSMSRSQS